MPFDSVEVIVETKRPGNKLEMVSKKDVCDICAFTMVEQTNEKSYILLD